MDQLYVSKKDESVRMFKSDFMEFFSHVHPATPVILYTPLIAYFLYAAFVYKNLPFFASLDCLQPAFWFGHSLST